jgi:hypothetical protein
MKFLNTQFSPVSCHFLPLQCKYLPQHHQPALFPQYYTQSVRASQTPAKIMVFHILMLIFLDIKQEDKLLTNYLESSSSRNTDNLLLIASCKRCWLLYTERRN